jgi:hypothetical protein
MRMVAFPFKRPAFRDREIFEEFSLGLSPGPRLVRVVFAWAEGKNPWRPVGEAEVISVNRTKTVKDPKYDKRWTSKTRRLRIP